MLSYKNYKWLYEREWRMFANPGKAYYRRIDCVARAYIGSRMDPGARSHAIALLKSLKIKTRYMVINEYFLDFVAKPVP